MAAPGALIAVDWGTSRLRALLLDGDGRPLAEAESDDGIGRLASGAHAAAFDRLVAEWPKVPALMAGMVGSRQGWREAPYVPVPATAAALAAKVLRFETSDGRPVAIVPGLVVRDGKRDGDVIRGEETQIVGLVESNAAFDGIVILPGSHSKWATVADGAITDFQTFLTGEMFDLLSRHSLLRHSVAANGRDLSRLADFALAVRRTAEEGLPFLAAIFSVRVRQLLAGVSPEDNLAYLSGLVIGGEIAAAQAAGRLKSATALSIVGTKSLARAYGRAFEILGQKVETLDGKEMVTAGLIHIARSMGLLPGERTA